MSDCVKIQARASNHQPLLVALYSSSSELTPGMIPANGKNNKTLLEKECVPKRDFIGASFAINALLQTWLLDYGNATFGQHKNTGFTYEVIVVLKPSLTLQ